MQSPLLFPPTKKTEEVDFGPPFRAYIISAYGDDPDKYSGEIGLLNRLRDDTRGAGKDITGRDILYRYYGQLELLDLRFPIDDKHVKVLFTWNDAFSGKATAQNAVAYEKACVIFSIAATCGAIAGSQDRSDPLQLKVAFNHLQAAAGLFAYINDNFLHPPSVDLSRESVKALEHLMLAQAQELVVEKCLVENKQGAFVAKLSAQAANLYLTAKDALSVDAIKQQFSRAWIDLAKCKQNYFDALSHYHRSIQLEGDAKYGQVVSHMQKADTLAKDADSLAKYFARTYPSFSVSATNAQNSSLAILGSLGAATAGSPAAALIEMTKALALKVSDRKNSVVKDNDLIYHEQTPSVDSLPAIDKVAAAKNITFAELCPNGAADVPKIVGPDIFAKLVPLSVHTAASVYSEEQAKLLRSESSAVEAADQEMKVSLESMGIVAALDKLKRVMKGGSSGVQDVMGSDESLELGQEVRTMCETIRSQEIGRGTGTDELLGVLEGLKAKIKGTLDEIGLMLDKEQHECETLRVKYMNSWNQEPSVKLTAQIRHDIRVHRESFEKALATDQTLLVRLNECRRDVATMSRPLDEVQSIFAELIRAVATLKKSDVAVGNLIDDGPGTSGEGLGKLGEQIIVEKLDGMIQQLRKLKTERATAFAELKTKVREDDISTSLLLNKNKENQVFQTELAKFKPYQSRLATNIATHNQLLVDISTEYEKLRASSTTIKVLDLRERRRNEIIKDWKTSFNIWTEAKEGLNRGVRFYTDLSDLAQSLKNTVVGFVNRRGEESSALVKRIEAEEAMKGQRTLQNEMARLSLASTTAPPTPLQTYPTGPGGFGSPVVTSPVSGSAVRPSFPQAPAVPAAPAQQPQYAVAQSYGNSSAIGQSYQSAPTQPPGPSYGGAPAVAYMPSSQQPTLQQHQQQPVYGGAPNPQQPGYGNAQPVYGGAPSNQQPVYGGAPSARPAPNPPPVYGGQPSHGYNQTPQQQAPQQRPPAPVQHSYYPANPQQQQQPPQPFGGVAPQQQRPSGGYGQPAPPQPHYGGQPQYSQPVSQAPPVPQKQPSYQSAVPYGQAGPPQGQYNQYSQAPTYGGQQISPQQYQYGPPQTPAPAQYGGQTQYGQPPPQQYGDAPSQQYGQYSSQGYQQPPQAYGAPPPPAAYGMGQQAPPQGPPQPIYGQPQPQHGHPQQGYGAPGKKNSLI
ncbi:BRO1-like domain-containing protein [Obelidium mucronatum]|nr:BRO1-like domain-containing protein [Obelidium mucronatum]